jgi:tRNA(Ile)-lysidine synthase
MMFTLPTLEDTFHHLGVDLEGSHFLIAYSGGLDSTVLMESMLQLTKKHDFTLTLGHVNHHLRPDSNGDEVFCREMAKKASVPFYCISLDPKGRVQESIESWARRERYAALEQVRAKVGANWTLTAHHADDQIETVLMRLLQKASLLGLAGIRPRMGHLLRPLLSYPKSTLHEWAVSENLSWIEDPSNTDMQYLRNQLRHGMIAKLILAEQNHRKSLLELARLGQDYENHCSSLAGSLAAVAREGSIPGTVAIPKEVLVNTAEEDLFKLVIKRLVQDYLGLTVNLSAQHWQNFRHFVLKSAVGKVFDLSADVQILTDRSELILYQQSRATPPRPSVLELGRTKWGYHEFMVTTTRHGLAPGLWLRSWKPGDRIQFAPSGHSKLVSDLYIDSKLNCLEKAHWPVLTTQQDEIVWVPGLREPETSLKRDLWEIKWQTKIRRR